MKKLKSLQLPIPSTPPPNPLQQQNQPQIESTLSNSSISHSSPSTQINPIEKENIRRENHLENTNVGVGDMPPHVVNESMEISSGSTENPDVFNVVLQQQQQQQQGSNENRPRQYGRRSNPIRVSSLIVSESVNHSAAAVSTFTFFFVVFFTHG